MTDVMREMNRRIVLARYPQGAPRPDDFQLESQPLAPLQDGQVRVQTLWLSMDPFPRLRMDPHCVVAAPLALGDVVIGRGAGRVVESRNAAFTVGDCVAGELGWQTFASCSDVSLRKVDVSEAPMNTALGILGPPGLAASRLVEVAAIERGQTVVITAAAGAVGSLIAQLAKLRGGRVIGLAMGPPQWTLPERISRARCARSAPAQSTCSWIRWGARFTMR